MIRRAFLRWASAAAVAASVSFPGFGLKAQDLAPQPLQPNEKVQKVVLSPVLEALEEWNEARCEDGGILHEGVLPTKRSHRMRITELNYDGDWSARKMGGLRLGGTFALKTRREMMLAFGGIIDTGEEN